MDIQPFKGIIKEKTGLHFESEKEANLADGIRARMSQRAMATDAEYLACLMRDGDEFHALVNLLTVNETYFFREPIHLDLLAGRLLAAWLAERKPGEPIRILCAGCSTGEEPYSVMIKLLEKYGAGIKGYISIIGADIDSDALDRAKQGIYSGFSFRDFPAALRQKYFVPTEDGRHRIMDFVREKVQFMKLNLMGDRYPDALCNIDVIFYRNVSIYFEPETQRSIFNKLAGLLREKGWLFVSATETMSHNHGVLPLIELDGIFCFQKNVHLTAHDRTGHKTHAREPSRPAAATKIAGPASVTRPHGPQDPGRPLPSPRAASRPAPMDAKTGTERSSFNDALAKAQSRRYEESLGCIDRLLAHQPSLTKGYLLKAEILITLECLDEAEQVCRQSIKLDPWSLEGHLLLGMIARLRNQSEAAVRRFKDALYIQSSCWLGHFFLAEIYAVRGEGKNALREYGIVINLLNKADGANHGPSFSLHAFSADQIQRVCQHNFLRLKQKSV
ncbi:MAG: CheR family methyltransferase [Desulfobacterales bacterium]|nr:CheR family methyltransferase [Desulfobacterales bacterium]